MLVSASKDTDTFVDVKQVGQQPEIRIYPILAQRKELLWTTYTT